MLSVQPATVTLLLFHLKTICQENRKEALCVTMTLGMRCIIIAPQFQHPRILTDFILPSEIQVFARFGSHTCYSHLTLL